MRKFLACELGLHDYGQILTVSGDIGNGVTATMWQGRECIKCGARKISITTRYCPDQYRKDAVKWRNRNDNT